MPDVINFDPNTGKPLSPGQTVLNNQTGQNVTQGTNFGSSPTTPTPAVATPPSANGMSDSSYLSVLNNLNNGLQQNNALVDQKNLIQKQLFDQPLSEAEMMKLPPDVRSIVQGGNQDQMKLQLQVINDSLQGRNNSVASSIQFLTTGWETAQTRKNTEEINVLNYAKAYNTDPLSIVKAMFPDLLTSMSPDQLKSLAKLGTPVEPGSAQLPNSTGGFPVGSTGPGTSASFNNATGLKDPTTGKYQTFVSADASITASANQLQNYANGNNTFGLTP